ncbi:hypothetical protein BC828DRAFT_383573 [Blastocladiella britannica]|nr:hypothetical protein BC828DRAFT_383573 [Blastocladiella britannica]
MIMPTNWTVSGPPSPLDAGTYMLTLVCLLATFVLSLGALLYLLVHTHAYRRQVRGRILVLCSGLFLVDSVANFIMVAGLQTSGSVDLFKYMMTRSIVHLLNGPVTMLAVSHRVCMLIPSIRVRRIALASIYVVSFIACVGIYQGSWNATANIVKGPNPTMNEWMYHWQFPMYGMLAAAIFPLMALISCLGSLHAAFSQNKKTPSLSAALGHMSMAVMPRFASPTSPEPSQQQAGVSPMFPPGGQSAATMPTGPNAQAPSSSALIGVSGGSGGGNAIFGGGGADRVSRFSSMASTVRRPSLSVLRPKEVSARRSFLTLTGAEVFLWLLMLLVVGLPQMEPVALVCKSAFHGILGALGVVVESTFEWVYRRELATASRRRAEHQARAPDPDLIKCSGDGEGNDGKGGINRASVKPSILASAAIAANTGAGGS